MEIYHDTTRKRFIVNMDGCLAYTAYTVHDGSLDIRHTVVPEVLKGQGIAGALVKAAYDYALEQGLKPLATCSYAVAWLTRHPEYHGEPSTDYLGEGSCGI